MNGIGRPKASLVLAKGKWYVQVTIPPELRQYLSNRKQIRRSTGTSDKRVAERLMHDKASEIYQELDNAGPDRVAELEDRLAFLDAPFRTGDEEEDYYALEAHKALLAEREAIEAELDEIEAKGLKLSTLAERFFETSPYSKHKTATEAGKLVSEYIEFAQDPLIFDITTPMAYQWAEALAQSYAKNSIGKRFTYVRATLDWGVRQGLLDSNPFAGVNLSGFGKKAKSYIPFTLEELTAIFAQSMPTHHRLLLGILLTTGMRLDEAALLDWEDIRERQGLRYFDLTERDETVKNIGSARMVPVPSVLEGPLTAYGAELGSTTGSMFPQFPRDADGKSQAAASKALMRHIRSVTDHPQKTVHSLRGTLKDLLRDAGVPKETNDYITGHGAGDVAGKYGSGPNLRTRQAALERLSWDYISL